jgi:hypothetical protein
MFFTVNGVCRQKGVVFGFGFQKRFAAIPAFKSFILDLNRFSSHLEFPLLEDFFDLAFFFADGAEIFHDFNS